MHLHTNHDKLYLKLDDIQIHFKVPLKFYFAYFWILDVFDNQAY